MNKLVLIGNGFDLAHGLKTKYSDFLLWYLNKSLRSLTSRAFYDDELIHLTIPYPRMLPSFTSLNEFKEVISQYMITFNTKNSFVTNVIYQSKQDNWVDIEAEYFYSLIDIYDRSKITGSLSVRSELIKLNVSFEYIKSKLIEYLSTIGDISHTNEEIKNHFYRELILDQKDEENVNTLFLNFNYTSSIELYKDSLQNSSFSEINYIHGKLKDESNPIIFGYGDEMDTYYEKIEQLNNNEFIKNIKSFDYLRTKNYQNFSRFIDSYSFDVYIMGHSCGLSDRILLNSIFEHDNCEKIKIFYYQKTKDENDFFEKTQEISRHFRPINKGRMRNKIVPFEDCKPLIEFKS